MTDPVTAVETAKNVPAPKSVEALMQKLGNRIDVVETNWHQRLERANKTGRELTTVPGLAEYRENMMRNIQDPSTRKVIQAHWFQEDQHRKMTAEIMDGSTKFSVVKSHLEIGMSIVSSVKKGLNQILSSQ